MAAPISRWAAVIDGLKVGLLEDEGHLGVLDRTQATGRFDPLPRSGFTKAYFHRAAELREEAEAASFGILGLFGLEGPGFLLSDVSERWADPRKRSALLECARRIEGVPELLGLSPHLLLVGRR